MENNSTKTTDLIAANPREFLGIVNTMLSKGDFETWSQKFDKDRIQNPQEEDTIINKFRTTNFDQLQFYIGANPRQLIAGKLILQSNDFMLMENLVKKSYKFSKFVTNEPIEDYEWGNYFLVYYSSTLGVVLENFGPEFKKYSLYTSKSLINGLGVFSTTDLEPFRLVTCYPCDAVNIKFWTDYKNKKDHSKYFGNSNPFGCADDALKYTCSHSNFKFGKKGYQIGPIGFPTNTLGPHFGHMLNENKTGNNCILQPLRGFWTVFSIKSIKAGEELTIDYGDTYKH